MPGETHYFDDVYDRSAQLGEVSDAKVLARVTERLYTLYERYYELEDQDRIERMFPCPSDLELALQGCGDYGCVLDRFMSLQMQGTAKTRWGNNAPQDLFRYKDIKELFPDAKFVVCIRDIRAFMLSYKGKWKTVSGDIYIKRMKNLYHPVVTSFLWKSSMRQVALLKSEIPSSDWVIVRYEDLVVEPERVMKEVFKTIDEEFDSTFIDVETHNSSSVNNEKGIFSTSVDRWLTELTPEEIAIGQYIAKNELLWLGYSSMDVPIKTRRLLKILSETPFALWKALYANRAVRGPLIPYLVKRVRVLFSRTR
jgi:hypothetical protein